MACETCNEKFYVGKQVQFRTTIRNRLTGALTDPTEVTLKYRYDSGPVTTVTWDDGEEIERESLGVFYYDLTPTQVGELYFKWYATGAGVGSDPGSITVEPDAFDF